MPPFSLKKKKYSHHQKKKEPNTSIFLCNHLDPSHHSPTLVHLSPPPCLLYTIFDIISIYFQWSCFVSLFAHYIGDDSLKYTMFYKWKWICVWNAFSWSIHWWVYQFIVMQYTYISSKFTKYEHTTNHSHTQIRNYLFNRKMFLVRLGTKQIWFRMWRLRMLAGEAFQRMDLSGSMSITTILSLLWPITDGEQCENQFVSSAKGEHPIQQLFRAIFFSTFKLEFIHFILNDWLFEFVVHSHSISYYFDNNYCFLYWTQKLNLSMHSIYLSFLFYHHNQSLFNMFLLLIYYSIIIVCSYLLHVVKVCSKNNKELFWTTISSFMLAIDFHFCLRYIFKL